MRVNNKNRTLNHVASLTLMCSAVFTLSAHENIGCDSILMFNGTIVLGQADYQLLLSGDITYEELLLGDLLL